MEVTVNQQTYTVPDHCNVQVLLSDVLHQHSRSLAVAIGGNIVSKDHWAAHPLQPGDHITIIKATQGG